MFLIEDSSAIDEKIGAIKARYQIMGLSLLVTKRRDVIFSKGYGFAHKERQINVDKETKYRVASISKLVTATALMQLYEQGKLQIDDDVSQYLDFALRNPHFPTIPITLKQLLTHTSGLRDGRTYEEFSQQSHRTPSKWALKDIVVPDGTYYSDDIWSAEYRPGDPAGWVYCNLASGVIASVIEKVSGEHFPLYCTTHIFAPLGMEATFVVQDLPDLSKLSILYRHDPDTGEPYITYDDYTENKPVAIDYEQIPLGHNGSIYAPQGGLRASVIDLSKFMLAQMNGGEYHGAQILDPKTVALMHQIHWTGYGDNGRYRKKGLQFHITDDLIPGETLIGHGADAYGLIGDMYFDQGYNFGIIALMNGGRVNLSERGFYEIEETMMNTLYQELIVKDC